MELSDFTTNIFDNRDLEQNLTFFKRQLYYFWYYYMKI